MTGESMVTPVASPSNDRDGLLRLPSGADAAVDHIRALIRAEDSDAYALPGDYLAAVAAGEGDSESWRRKLCEWCYEVVDHFTFDRECVAIALNLLDRTITSHVRTQGENANIKKKDYQRFTVGALYTAIKVHGEVDTPGDTRLKLKIDSFVELSRGHFSDATIEETERDILQTLKWRVNPPTLARFIHSYVKICPLWTQEDFQPPASIVHSELYEKARYLAELSVCVTTIAFKYKPSAIAYAALLCAMDTCQRSAPVPYPARVAFLNNLSQATQKLPHDQDIRKLVNMLKDLAPSLFTTHDLSLEYAGHRYGSLGDLQQPEDHTERSSPVSVAQPQGPADRECPRSGRKRNREEQPL